MTYIFSSPLLPRDYSNDGNCLNVGRTQLAGMNSENGTISQRKIALGMKLTHGSPLYGHEGKTWLITRCVQEVFLGFPWFSGWTFGQTQYMPHLRPAKKYSTRSKDAIRCQAECWARSSMGVHLPFTQGLHIFFGAYPNMTLGVAASGVDWPGSPSNSCWLYQLYPNFQPLNPQASW